MSASDGGITLNHERENARRDITCADCLWRSRSLKSFNPRPRRYLKRKLPRTELTSSEYLTTGVSPRPSETAAKFLIPTA